MALPSDLGLLYKVAPQRELRLLELQWCLPWGKMRDARWVPPRCRPAAASCAPRQQRRGP